MLGLGRVSPPGCSVLEGPDDLLADVSNDQLSHDVRMISPISTALLDRMDVAAGQDR